ncbi:MAG TPA: hypothetical protein VFE41_29260 [Acetobacteraceae bacterium]|jgi:hypothetical protein|nr:hypothetical protein [Acetobacteraceae bacterium]
MKALTHCFLLLMAIILLAPPQTARGEAPDDAPQVRILHPDAAPEIVWSHATQACDATDYSDVPARPFLGDGGRRVFWFASASPAYFATVGAPPEPGQDILAKAHRIRDPGGNCVTWITPASYGGPLGVPQSYDTGLWMQSVYTPDGNHIFALVHNEFHGELTAPPGHPSKYCTITQAFFLAGNACSYWNMVGAASTDGGRHFRLYKTGGLGTDADYNAPVLASPHPYLLPADNGGNNPGLSGLLTVSNIIRWGGYYYVLVQQVPSAVPARQPPDGQEIGRNGTCIYRTDRLFDRTSWLGWNGTEYAVPTVTRYPSNITDPVQYTCTPVLNGIYRFSWSYNSVLRQFIVLGIDTQYGPNKIEAFVYTTARLAPGGRLIETSAEHLLREINWLDRWSADPSVTGQAYPSLLDPRSRDIARRLHRPMADSAGHVLPLEDDEPAGRGDDDGLADFSFEYSGSHPYVYFTLLHPIGPTHDHTNRDLVRQKLQVGPATDPDDQ